MKMKTHYVIERNSRVIHSGTQRGCRAYVTINGRGRVITAEDWETIQALREAQEQIKKAAAEAAEERRKLFLDPSAKAGASEYLKTRPLRYELRGELGRAMMAFCHHEGSKPLWCGTFNGGTYFFENSTYYGWLADTQYFSSAECLLARIAAYARRAYRTWQGDAFGMRVAADLLAATALVENVTWITPQ